MSGGKLKRGMNRAALLALAQGAGDSRRGKGAGMGGPGNGAGGIAGEADGPTNLVPERTRETVRQLARRQPVAVLSNFFLTGPIEELLRRDGVARHLAHIEVSATSGYMKPHGTPFARVREALNLDGGRALMVGDDFWCDVVGGHRAGFETALTHEHRQDEPSDPDAPEVRPGRILKSLDELAR